LNYFIQLDCRRAKFYGFELKLLDIFNRH